MRKRDLLKMEIETVTTHSMECGSCCKVFESQDTIRKFLDELEGEMKWASSKEFNSIGFVCNECFDDPDADWEPVPDPLKPKTI